MNRLLSLVLLLSVTGLYPLSSASKPEVFSGVPLLGTSAVPANQSNGYGAITAVYDDETNILYYEFEWELNKDAEATAAHFHGPAAIGETAPVTVDLGPVSGNSGKVTGSVQLSEAEEAELEQGMWYINIHSTQVPSGELRGQMVEFSPLDTAAVYDSEKKRLKLKSTLVPKLGVFEVEMDLINNPFVFQVDFDGTHPKDLSGDDSQ